ncbi:WD40 repeat-like protein [Lophiostoma macrostomum CBS 122681]|uniref:WD40 repeat-like protein n=1 Tax=Lophiostoma macrostomum CBS 122681 TaxID=1314788 RepID=A0A6A6SXP1_9PLEO|nr:WD40 repeat-like protein [Lophiostoma macrostomum CBS 122681]
MAMIQTLSSGLGLPPNSYIYKLISTSPRHDPYSYSQTDQLAAISSDDSLRIFDPATLNIVPNGIINAVNESVTCLERADDPASNLIATAGRDGYIHIWDKRTQQKALRIESPYKLISALTCNTPRNFLAAGIENPEDGPGVCPVYIWDQRNISAPQLSFTESHTDTITNLKLHPDLPTLLLSGSTDGLINIFDTSKPDEDDALYQVINHRSAVAHAGFVYPSTDIYALGTDETMSFYALQSQSEDEEEPAPRVFGDVREGLGCEYVVKMHWIGDEAFIAAGKHSSSTLSLNPVTKRAEGGPLGYEYDLGRAATLEGAHGEEVVRDVFTDVHAHTTYTCGEDGYVRAWKFSEEGMDVDEEMEGEQKKITEKKESSKKEKRKEKKDKKRKSEGGDRFKPY